MIVKILGVLDLIAVIILLIKNYFDKSAWFPIILVLIAGSYLIIKGIIFILTLDFASIIDIVSGIIIVFAAYFHLPLLLSALVIILLGQKAFFSLVS
jgi:hypothetical protein